MKKPISILLIVTMLMSFVPAIAADAQLPVIECSYDTFIAGANYADAKQNEDKAIIFAGDVYDRTVFFEFDISDGVPENSKGAIFSFTARPSATGANLTVYGIDDIESFSPYSQIISIYEIPKSGKILCQFSVLKYINQCIAEGKSKAIFAVKSSVDVLPIFASETSAVSDKPVITYTDVEPYIKGSKDQEYPEITREMLAGDIRSMQSGGHPYLFARKSDFERIRKDALGANEYLTNLYAGVKKTASSYLNKPVEVIKDLSISYLSRGFSAWEIVSQCAFVYQIEGDASYAQRAYDEAAYFADLDGLGTNQALDRSQAIFALALAYDWLYDWMDSSQRTKLKECLLKDHLEIISRYLTNTKSPEFSATTYWSGYIAEFNHGVMDNSSSVIAALAAADDDNVDFYADLIYMHIKRLEICFDNFYPDSGWSEGASYWSFVGPFVARMFACMKSGLGTWYGYEDYNAIISTSDWPLYMQSSLGYYMVNDNSIGASHNVEKYYFAIMKDDPALKKLVLDIDKPKNSPFLCIWYDTELDHNSVSAKMPLDKQFRNIDQVIFRDTWGGNQELYTGMTVTNGSAPHNHIKSGTFVLDALGERWITNHGNESYSVAGYWESGQNGRRWRYYATRAEANSCLVINPSEDGGQNVFSEDIIDRYASNDAGAYAYTHLNDTYKDQVTDYWRGLMLTNNRQTVVMQDEVKLVEPSLVYSFVNINQCEVEVSEDQKTIILKKGSKKVYVNVICDQPYEFSIMRSVPLETSNLLPGSKRNPDVKKLAFKFDNIKELNMRLEFTPYLFDEDIKDIKDSEFVPINEWTLPDEIAVKPTLSSLTFDGVPADNFHPENRCYALPAGSTLPKIDAKADSSYNVEVTKISDYVCKILLTDKSNQDNTNTYIVYVSDPPKEPKKIDVTGLKKLSITSVSATAHDGNKPENVIDGDFSTRWSANGEHSVSFTLDKPHTVNCIAIAWTNGNTRYEFFDLEVSEDGKNWESIYDLQSTGVTTDFEYFDLGDRKIQYIRYKGYGNNTSLWNSLSEVEVYGK